MKISPSPSGVASRLLPRQGNAISVAVLAPAADAAAFARTVSLTRGSFAQPAPLILGEVPRLDIGAVGPSLKLLAEQASSSGQAELARVVTVVRAATTLPATLDTVRQPDASALDVSEVIFKNLSPVLAEIRGLGSGVELVAVGFTFKAAWDALTDGRFTVDDVAKPVIAAAKLGKILGASHPAIDMAIPVFQTGSTLMASEHVVGVEGAVALGRILPAGQARPA